MSLFFTLAVPFGRIPTFLVLVAGIAQHLERTAIMVFIDP